MPMIERTHIMMRQAVSYHVATSKGWIILGDPILYTHDIEQSTILSRERAIEVARGWERSAERGEYAIPFSYNANTGKIGDVSAGE